MHHLCQSVWEQREGYGDTVVRYCCVHHPDYKYWSTPPKDSLVQEDDAVAARAQDVVAQAKVINIESQLMAVDIKELLGDEGGSEGIGDDEVVGVELPPFEITDYTTDTYDIHEQTAHFMCKAEIASKVQDKYKEFIRNIPLERFSDSSLKVDGD